MGINIVDVFFDVVKQSITNNDGDYQLPKHAAYFDSMPGLNTSERDLTDDASNFLRKIKKMEVDYYDWEDGQVSNAMKRARVSVGKKLTNDLISDCDKIFEKSL